MNNTQENQPVEKKSHRVLLLLIVGLAAFSSAMNELNQAQSLTLKVGELVSAWSEIVVPTANASAPIISPSFIENSIHQNSRSDEFRWDGVVAPGAAIEVKGINGEIVAEPTSDSEVHVIATKTSRRSDVNTVKMKVVQHAGGVTICALYPNEDGEYLTDCGPGDGQPKDASSTGTMRNNDVQVHFTVRVPRHVTFVGKTINGAITATSLNGNVITRTINGAIKISTTGYAEANTINGEINARLGDVGWSNSLTFKTINGEINLDLPSSLSADVDAQTLNGAINSDFPLNVTNLKGRKYVKGTIGAGGRDLILRTLNGSINLRIGG
jgi:hypothetical protein